MPEIGEIRRETEIGFKGKGKYIWTGCIDCGKERWIKFIKGEPDTKRCRKCGHTGILSGTWKGGKVKRECLNCGKVFSIKPSKLNHGRGKFCSRSCELIHLRKQGYFRQSPNKIEQTLLDLFQKHNIPFKHAGSGEVWLGNRNPDFINTNGKKQVIELFGIYWHPLFDGANRIEHYKRYGFECLAIWEDELVDLNKVLGKVKRFTKRQLYAITG